MFCQVHIFVCMVKSLRVLKMIYYTERLKEIREYNGIPQKEIANELGISQQHYSMYENGKRILNAEQIIKICKTYNISANYLLGLSDEFQTLPQNRKEFK